MKLHTLDDKMSLRIETDLKQQVIAYGYVLGFEGSYSDTIRHILRTKLPSLVEDLPEEKQKEYQTTLEQLEFISKQKMELLSMPTSDEKEIEHDQQSE